MTILHHDRPSVQPEPADLWPDWTDAYRYAVMPDDEDDDRPGADDGPSPEPTTDRAWLLGEADYHLSRAGDDAALLVYGELRAVASAMAFHRTDDATKAAAALGVDLDELVFPSLWRSPLAGAVAAQAAWYAHLDSPVGSLAAWHLLYLGAQVERLGSATKEEYRIDEAAWRMAALEAVESGTLL